MAPTSPQRGKPAGSYGIDAPYVLVIFVVGAIVFAGLALGNLGGTTAWWWLWAVLFCVFAALYANATLRKAVIWQQVLDSLDLRGDEETLDAGCGRGLVLVMSALRVPRGHATGLDLWRSQDQSGNNEQATTANVAANDVADRVELVTGDLRSMPLPDDTYHLVTSSIAIQNIKDRAGRREAVAELYRVAAPGGRIEIVNIQFAAQYAADLRELGAEAVTLTGCGPNGWFGLPFYYTSKRVSARKPGTEVV